MQYTDDPVADYDAYCRAQDKAMEDMPFCEECGKRIEEEFCYQFDDVILCEDCVERCRKYTADLVE